MTHHPVVVTPKFGCKPSTAEGDVTDQTKALAAKMGNLVILRKGRVDTISDGSHGMAVVCVQSLHFPHKGCVFTLEGCDTIPGKLLSSMYLVRGRHQVLCSVCWEKV